MDRTEYDPLLPTLAVEPRAKYRVEVLKQLRAEANLVVNKDARSTAAQSEEETPVD